MGKSAAEIAEEYRRKSVTGSRVLLFVPIAILVVVAALWVKTGPSLLSGTLAIVAVVFLFHLQRERKQFQEDIAGLQQLHAGQYLAHWRFDSTLWEQTAATEKSKKLRQSRISAWIAFGWLGGATTIIIILAAPARERYALLPAIVFIAIWFGLFSWALGKRQAEKEFRATLDSESEIRIGETGVCWGSDYYPIRTLENLKEDQTPPLSLVFTFVTGSRRGRTWRELRVSVPPGKEQEANRVINALAPIARAKKEGPGSLWWTIR